MPGSPRIASARQVLRLAFELEGETFDWALVQRDSRFLAKYDQHDDPEQEFPARVFTSQGEAIITFVHKDQTIFVHLEPAA